MEETRTFHSREEIPAEYKWAMEHLYATEESWEEELKSLKQDQDYLVSFAGKLGDSGETLCRYLTGIEAMLYKAEKLSCYAMRKADEDTRNGKYQAMAGKFMSVYVAVAAACSFDTPEIMAISDETLEGFYTDCEELRRFRRHLTDVRRMKPHTLSAGEEKLLTAAAEMAEAPSKIFTTFSNADLTYPDAVDSRGTAHPLTQGTFGPLMESADRQLRRSAYENLYDTVGSFKNTAAAMVNAQNKQLKFFAEARHYGSAFEAALFRSQVPTDVYLNLIDAVRRNMDKMHRYVRLRKKLLGVEELHFYDVYAPLVADVDRRIPYEEAKQTVYDALAPLGEEYRAILKESFENRWIDVYQNPGKRAGAYSSGGVVHPYVLLNYNGTLDNQFTLAHEMGHAIHTYLSRKYQAPIDADYSIFVAEVASTCNEALLMEHLLSKTTEKKERAYLLNHFLEQFKATLYRQTMFAEFELTIGRMCAEGKTLTAEALCREYKRLNEEYFGPDMVVDDRIATEWARIPHFYYNYYVFQYATGYSAAVALSRKILAEGEQARDAYLGFLSGGCSKSPIQLLKDAGVDMTTTEPIEQALALFGQLLDEMEALMED